MSTHQIAHLAPFLTLLLVTAGTLQAQDRRTQVFNDREKFLDSQHWIYNDLEAGIREAKRQDRPLLVVFRCIPCEACHEFDEQVAERDPIVRSVMAQYVCVRIPMANAMDLTQFQFDFDQSFAAFLMHHDGTLLGRFGTRSGRDNEQEDISLDGLRKALEAGLAFYAQYDKVKPSLAGKQVKQTRYERPQDYPSLAGRYQDTLDYEGQVVQSCLHCHQIGEAQRLVFRNQRQAIPADVLYPYPHPKVLGLTMDPAEMATVSEVAEGSVANKAGIQTGDRIASLEGQPVLSIADVQWVLHHAPSSGELQASIERGGERRDISLQLAAGWRKGDISWRSTTWDLRKMALGGLSLEDLPSERRGELGLDDDKLALHVWHLGMYNDHAAALRAGFRKGDILVGFDGRGDRMTESQLIEHSINNHFAGERVPVTVLRDGNKIDLVLPIQ
ncbi:MAG: Trx7/PDZ domain-containing (seleno)protein [Pirellulales bacterium]